MKKTILIASVLFLVACGATKAGKNPNPIQATEKVILLDRYHKTNLKLVKSKIEKLPSGQMQVVAEIENRNNDSIPTDIQVTFLGADGFEVEKTGWTPFNFQHHDVSTFKATSMAASPTDYRITIRKPD
jgi:uncharacterized protein YcfL